MIKVKVKTDMRKAERKLSKKSTSRGQYAVANQMLSDMNQFVPMRGSHLRTTGHVAANNEQLIWDTPYAKAQYYGSNGKATFRKYTTPGTGKRWDLVAKGNHIGDWERAWIKGAGF